ncbi:MAG: 2OG-Fe(II) oxygenase [Fluviicola sp.]|nr:MAG: 2OG-Fe(II) oxygenase [Fluviicola sp.]
MEEQNIWENRMDTLSQFDYVVMDNFLSFEVLSNLKSYFSQKENQDKLDKAAIGATGDSKVINEIRGDYTYWLDKSRDEQDLWLFEVLDEVKSMINRFCFLSLSDYEFHLALYPEGSFYKKHLDQFKGRNNRMISMIIYLNENWHNGDGGELKIYPEGKEENIIAPLENRCILFRSDVLYHEVLPTNKPRKSVTGWMLYQPSPLITVSP